MAADSDTRSDSLLQPCPACPICGADATWETALTANVGGKEVVYGQCSECSCTAEYHDWLIAGRKWLPMDEAPKDGRYILAVYKSLDGYALQLDGRAFVIRHEGKAPGGYDLGWALFPGHGGVPDKCLSCWQPIDLPTPETRNA
jgi:hypothetical protein